jgi:hypothetical protein
VSLDFRMTPVAEAGDEGLVPAHRTAGDAAGVTPFCRGVQPVSDVRAYLGTRRPAGHPAGEPELFATLPSKVRTEVLALLAVAPVIRAARSVSAGVAEAVRMLAVRNVVIHPKTLRARYDAFVQAGDWVKLVDCRRAGAAWWEDSRRGLPDPFLDYIAAKFAQARRADGKRQAWFRVLAIWRTGRNAAGQPESIPGYGRWQDWFARSCPQAALPFTAPIPAGWSYPNVLKAIKRRAKFSRAVQAAAHEGVAKARDFVPGIRSTREGLRFLEEVQFDDVRCDFRVFDPATGEVMDLWLLVAHDRATALKLGFGMRPARAREDGTQEHLRLQDMKQLAGWVLERWGLPPYVVTWKIENGTATFTDAAARALGHLFDQRIRVSFAKMLGGVSPAGYRERAKGNSKGKASLESTNRLLHTTTSDLPGQMGRLYEVRPADLLAREKEAREIWKAAQFLPGHLRGQEYPLATLDEARRALVRSFDLQNARTEHELEGFEKVLVWRRSPQHPWTLHATDPVPHPVPAGAQVESRKESPYERAARLVAPYRDQWSAVSPDAIWAFYEHTQRDVKVNETGQVEFRLEGRDVAFMAPPGVAAPPAGTKLLAYHHPDDPGFLHLATTDGRYVGTWPRVALVKANDTDALSQAIAAQQAALNTALQRAAELVRPEREALEAMRARNAERLQFADFVEVGEPLGDAAQGHVEGPLTRQLAQARTTLADTRRELRRQERTGRSLTAAADDALESVFGGT